MSEAPGFLAGGGEMGALMRSLDWSSTPIGPAERWPPALRTAVSICLSSRFPICLWWGQELAFLYNDPYRPMLGASKHPAAMGRPGEETWREIWDVIGPMLRGVMERGEATWSEDQLLLMDRNGYLEEAYFTFSYSPIREEAGEVRGVFTAVTETTERVLADRRLRTVAALAARTAEAHTVAEVCKQAVAALAGNPEDVPFARLRLDADCVAETGRVPPELDLGDERTAVVLPVRATGSLVAGVTSRRDARSTPTTGSSSACSPARSPPPRPRPRASRTSAAGPRRWPSSTGPRPSSSRTSRTSSAPRSR
jgi:hypothetical protein